MSSNSSLVHPPTTASASASASASAASTITSTTTTSSTTAASSSASSRRHNTTKKQLSTYDDSLPPARPVVPVLSASTSSSRYNSSSATTSRPRTAPSSQSNKPPDSAFEPPIPKIAIFADALSLKKLREQYQTIRKSPTLPDLSHSSDLKRPQSQSQARRIHSATSTTSLAYSQHSPQLPELDFDSKSFAYRRAPASRSSNGVDTGKGPPPAIATRSTSYTADTSSSARRPQSASSSTSASAFHRHSSKPYTLRSPTSEVFRHSSDSYDRRSNELFSPLSPGIAPSGFEGSLDAIMDHNSTYSDAQEYLDERAAAASSKYARGGLSPGLGISSGAGTEGSGRGSTEDLFLNEAQDSPAPSAGGYDASGHLERRLSRGRGNPQRTSLPISSRSTRRDSIGSHESGARSIIPTSSTNTADQRSYSQRRASTTSTPPLMSSGLRHPSSLPPDNRFNMYRSRYAGSSSSNVGAPTTTSSTPQQHSSRRPSIPDGSSMYSRPATYRPSKLNQFSTRDLDSVSMADSSPLEHRAYTLRSESHYDGGGASVISDAQSMMAAELHDLRNRVHRMEHEKMVSTGSNGSNERPKTATTATTPLTTMSSSPKYQFKTGRSPQDSVIGGPAAVNAYPVLHQTLDRCRDALSPQVYRALEMATSDALELALLTGNTGAGGGMSGAPSVVHGGFSGERQLKRRADNVVRNLQDLCVELCKVSQPTERFHTPSSRPGTSSGRPISVQDQPPAPGSSSAGAAPRSSMVRAQSRASSVEPSTAATSDTQRAVPSRALDRIEARRVSMNLSASNSPREAPEGFNRNSLQLPTQSVETTPSHSNTTQILQQTPPVSKLPRSGTSLLRSRRAATEERDDDDNGSSFSPRPVSRAATEIGSTLRKRQNRLSGSHLQRGSREYTSNVPLPNSSPVTAAPPQQNTHTSTPPTSTSLRRLNGTSLRNESPRAASFASSLLREPRRAATVSVVEKERSVEPETPSTPVTPSNAAATGEEEGSGNRRLLRRSLGLYTSSARASLGLGLGKRGERRSLAAAGGGE